MFIKSLYLKNFRNYSEEQIAFNDGINILTGANAQGKTNAAEAIFFLCTGYSPRANRDKLLVRHGEEQATIKGSAVSRNIALQKANGRWIAFLDSDDLWHPEKLEKQIEFMKQNNYRFSYTNYCEIDETSKERGILISGPEVITRKMMTAYCWPGCLTVMYDAEFLGLMQTADIKINEEYALWIRIARQTNCYLLKENLAKYRRHKGSLTSKSYMELAKWHYLMFRKAENKNVIASLFCTLGNLIFGTYKKLFYCKKY